MYARGYAFCIQSTLFEGDIRCASGECDHNSQRYGTTVLLYKIRHSLSPHPFPVGWTLDPSLPSPLEAAGGSADTRAKSTAVVVQYEKLGAPRSCVLANSPLNIKAV